MLQACIRFCSHPSTTQMSSAESWAVVGMLVAILLAFIGGYFMGYAVGRDEKRDDKDHGKWWESPDFWHRPPGGPTVQTMKVVGPPLVWADSDSARDAIQTSDEARKVFE